MPCEMPNVYAIRTCLGPQSTSELWGKTITMLGCVEPHSFLLPGTLTKMVSPPQLGTLKTAGCSPMQGCITWLPACQHGGVVN